MVWIERSIPGGPKTITKMRFRFYNSAPVAPSAVALSEVDLGQVSITNLTSEFVDYEFTIWDTSKKIQFRFTNAEGDDFQISNYEIIEPALEGAV